MLGPSPREAASVRSPSVDPGLTLPLQLLSEAGLLQELEQHREDDARFHHLGRGGGPGGGGGGEIRDVGVSKSNGLTRQGQCECLEESRSAAEPKYSGTFHAIHWERGYDIDNIKR